MAIYTSSQKSLLPSLIHFHSTFFSFHNIGQSYVPEIIAGDIVRTYEYPIHPHWNRWRGHDRLITSGFGLRSLIELHLVSAFMAISLTNEIVQSQKSPLNSGK